MGVPCVLHMCLCLSFGVAYSAQQGEGQTFRQCLPPTNMHIAWLTPGQLGRAELQREARHYAADPAPVTRGCVAASRPWLDDAWHAQAGDGPAARAEEERIRVEAAWGRWLWLVAELAPHGAPHGLAWQEAMPHHVRSLYVGLVAAVTLQCSNTQPRKPTALSLSSSPRPPGTAGCGWSLELGRGIVPCRCPPSHQSGITQLFLCKYEVLLLRYMYICLPMQKRAVAACLLLQNLLQTAERQLVPKYMDPSHARGGT